MAIHETEIVGMQLNLFKQTIDFHLLYPFLERLTGKTVGLFLFTNFWKHVEMMLGLQKFKVLQ